MISRRLFLGGLLAGAAAPAIVRASSLMPIKAPKVWVAVDLGDDKFGTRGFIQGEIGRIERIRVFESGANDVTMTMAEYMEWSRSAAQDLLLETRMHQALAPCGDPVMPGTLLRQIGAMPGISQLQKAVKDALQLGTGMLRQERVYDPRITMGGEFVPIAEYEHIPIAELLKRP